MTIKKIIFKSCIVLIFVIMLVLGVIFMMASTVPSEYTPLQMQKHQREIAAKSLVSKASVLIDNFQCPKAFEHIITERELNQYLGSLDEIAYNAPGKTKKKSGVSETMDKMGVSTPFIHLSDKDGGTMTLMICSDEYKKIFSLDIAFEITDDDRDHIKTQIKGIRIGNMPIPKSVIDGGIASLKDSLPDAEEFSINHLSSDFFEQLLVHVVRSIDTNPLPTTLTVKKHSKKIHRINISEGQLTIEFIHIANKKS